MRPARRALTLSSLLLTLTVGATACSSKGLCYDSVTMIAPASGQAATIPVTTTTCLKSAGGK